MAVLQGYAMGRSRVHWQGPTVQEHDPGPEGPGGPLHQQCHEDVGNRSDQWTGQGPRGQPVEG